MKLTRINLMRSPVILVKNEDVLSHIYMRIASMRELVQMEFV